MLLLVSLCGLSLGQGSRITLYGTIRDASNGESLLGVYVVLNNLAVPSDVQGGVTNESGYYSVSVAPGTYKLTVNYLGYRTITDTVRLTGNKMMKFDLEPVAIEGDEVVIQGESSRNNVHSGEVGRMTMSVESIKAIPALMGEADVIKSVQLLPGVQSGGEGNSGFYVRGGGTDQNLILLDEATIYNANHLFGFFSVFNVDAVKNIDMIKSGMPAYYGGRAASILNVSQKEGNLKRWEVDGGLGLIFSHLTVQGPIKRTNRRF